MKVDKINIGIIQLEPILGDVKLNTNKALEMIDEASTLGAEIICLPELFSTGYDQEFIKRESLSMAKESTDFTLSEIKKRCKKNKVSVIAPIPEYNEKLNTLYNSAFVINGDGGICHIYRKIHLWDEERCNFRGGYKIDSFNINGIDLGIMICYDSGFPEVARILALKGAKIIFVPTAWVDSGEWAFYTSMAARALENGVFIVAVNRVGIEGDAQFFGGSTIFNPKGEIVTTLSKFEESVKVFELDLNEVENARNQTPYLRDRRPCVYSELIEKH